MHWFVFMVVETLDDNKSFYEHLHIVDIVHQKAKQKYSVTRGL